MSNSCQKERNRLLQCLADSECIEQGRSVAECMELDKSCKARRIAFANCKRGQLDMRKRMQGNLITEEADEEKEVPKL